MERGELKWEGGRSIRLLFLSNLFPDAGQPIRGLDNATLLHALARRQGWEIRALALRPVLSLGRPAPRSVSFREEDLAFQPRAVPVRYLPKVGSRWNDALARRDLESAFAGAIGDFRPHLVLAAWLYPDGCAAAGLCAQAGLPLALVAQGTDVHGYLDHPVRRRKILAAAAASAGVICRSGDLARRLEEAGAPREKLHVVYNGVDTEVFRPRDRAACRAALGLPPDRPLLLFVGNLLPVKDPLFLLRAAARLNRRRRAAGRPQAALHLIGEGPLRGRLEREIHRLGAGEWVRLAGRLPPAEVARWMGAADLLCLGSRNEGFPNVILEAMACGLPVVSTDVGGIAEKVGSEAPGRLVAPGDEPAYAAALEAELEAASAGDGGRRERAPGLSWEAAADRYGEILLEMKASIRGVSSPGLQAVSRSEEAKEDA